MDRRNFLALSVAAAAGTLTPVGRALAAVAAALGDVRAVGLDGGAVALGAAELQRLQANLRGSLLLPGNGAYEQARRLLNESIDRRPALVVQPAGAADVRTVVDFAREHRLLTAVKCGGHGIGGTAVCEGGLQVDLSRMRGVRVDPIARRAWVGGGSLLGDLDHEAMSHGLVTTAGTVSHTGVGGLTLGGGYGRLARRHGLALDNVVSVDIVTADGQLRHASATENPDLYWGVRGGGGNFGIVTAFEFQLHPMQREVVGGTLIFPLARARELLQAYSEISMTAPRELYMDAVVSARMGGAPGVFLFSVCHSGSPEQAERDLAPLRKLGTPLRDNLRSIDYVALQRSTDDSDPRGEGRYLRSGYIDGFPADLAQALADGFQPDPERNSSIFFQHAGGRIAEVAADATALPARRATHNMFVTSAWPLASDGSRHVSYVQEFWRTVERHTIGWYSVEVTDEAPSEVERNYQGNLARLRKVKDKYDSTNLFRLNANVRPTAQAS